MSVKFIRPASRDGLPFTVEMALRKVSKRWAKRHRPGDRDRRKPLVKAALDRIELCATRRFGKSPGHGSTAAPGGAAGEAERRRYSGSVGAIPPISRAARRRMSISRLRVLSRSTARCAACSRSGSGGAFRGAYMRGITVARA